jgi:hypothetical protein
MSVGPGRLGRIGPITALQARELAQLADPRYGTEWRVIVISAAGRALAVSRIPRPTVRAGPGPPQGRAGVGLVARVTVIMPAAALDAPTTKRATRGKPMLAAVVRAARRATAQANARAAADAQAGRCAHLRATAAYRPSRRLHEYVVARDQTCRFWTCRQPAWRGDLDHSLPYHLGGLTCDCNLGGHCRTHHRIKQLKGWTLRQPKPGIFQWITPAGRTYTVPPDSYLI